MARIRDAQKHKSQGGANRLFSTVWTYKATGRRRLDEDGAASISRFGSVSGHAHLPFLDLMRTNSFQALGNFEGF
jgi:hypothetical protein